jgi:hypothetical protein
MNRAYATYARAPEHRNCLGKSCGSSVVEHSLGKGEVESSILSRSTSKTQRKSIVSGFPPENGAFQKYATKRENTWGNGKKLGRSWAGSPGCVFIMFTVRGSREGVSGCFPNACHQPTSLFQPFRLCGLFSSLNAVRHPDQAVDFV